MGRYPHIATMHTHKTEKDSDENRGKKFNVYIYIYLKKILLAITENRRFVVNDHMIY